MCLGLGIIGIPLAARVSVASAAATVTTAIEWGLTPAAVGQVAVFSCRKVLFLAAAAAAVVVVKDHAHEQADDGATGCEQDAVVFDSDGTMRDVVGYRHVRVVVWVLEGYTYFTHKTKLIMLSR